MLYDDSLFFRGNDLQRGDQVVTVLPDILKRCHDCFNFRIRSRLIGLDGDPKIAVLLPGALNPHLELIVRAVGRNAELLERRVLLVLGKRQKKPSFG